MSGDYVESLAKGLEVLNCFGRQATRLTLSDVARLTGATPASARRSLKTLSQLGYLDTDGKRFWMQPKVLLIAHAFLSSRPMPSLAQPLLDSLSERTRESASLGQFAGDDVIIVARSTARRSLSTGLAIGSRLPVYCSAIGRALLSGVPPEDARRRLLAMPRAAMTEKTLVSVGEILVRVASCRVHGWAASDGELELGVRSIAVPVRDQSGEVSAALSISVRAERMGMAEFQEQFLAPVMRARKSLEDHLFPKRGAQAQV